MKLNSKKRFYIDWVLINELSIGPPPRTSDHLNTLNAEGIKSILSLCSEKEASSPKEMYDKFSCKRILLPDHKSGRLATLDEINYALNSLKELITHGPVFIHCFAAMERSPLVCMAWLVREHNLSPRQSLDYMMQVHKGTSPLGEQLSMLNQISQ